MTITLILLLLFLGLVTGFYSGLIGTGGNIILIPALDLLFSYYAIESAESVKFIIAHSLFITVFLGIAVSYKQYRIGNFFWKEVLIIGIPGMITAYLLTEFLKNSQWYDKFYFDLVFLGLMFLLAIRLLFFKGKEKKSDSLHLNTKTKLSLLGLGGFTGIVTSLSGFGGGIVLVPYLTDIKKESIKKASSISIGVIMLLASAVSISYLFGTTQISTNVLPLQVGYISIYSVLPILVGIFIASSFGVKTAQKTSPQKLRVIFGIVVILLTVKMAINLLA